MRLGFSIVHCRRLFSTTNSHDTFLNSMDWKFICYQAYEDLLFVVQVAFVNFLSNFTNGLFRHFVCFEKVHSPVSELIHLARCVKFSPCFILGIVLIVFGERNLTGGQILSLD